jgi:hypothetical protein
MKTRKLVWLASLAMLGGFVSVGGPLHSAPVARPQLTCDGGDPVPPPPPFPPFPHKPIPIAIPA